MNKKGQGKRESKRVQMRMRIQVEKRKTTSDVWENFTRKKVDGKFKAQCHHCDKLYLGDSSQGTSHFRNHLARCPRLKFEDIRDMQQQVLIRQQNKVDERWV